MKNNIYHSKSPVRQFETLLKFISFCFNKSLAVIYIKFQYTTLLICFNGINSLDDSGLNGI